MRLFLALIFLTIFSFQVLPLKVIGKLLAKAQTTEEVQEDDADVDGFDGKVVKFQDDQNVEHNTFGNLAASVLYFNNKLSTLIHSSEKLPLVHVTKIPSPPPDFL